MTRIIYIIMCIALAVGLPLQAATPAARLAACATKITNAPSVTFKLTMTAGGTTTHPTLIVSGNKYRLSSPEMEVWYDGKTMWVYMPSTAEVNISEPTADELLECNPIALLSGYAGLYASREAGNDVVELTARGKASTLRKAVVHFDQKTNLPTAIDATMNGNQQVKIKIDSAVDGKTLPASTFIYNAKSYPAKEIIDLR